MRARAWAWWVLVLGAAAGARELDPAACAARFDVQPDKIIRTEESREMGARYLSELDVGARGECLRLCCETDACDVFVYEEKGPGSCYLFECGPPEDFRCKFTSHSNFSSGVLALSRRLAELQDQEQRAHRERELASLRSATSTTLSTSTSTTPSSLAAAAVVAPQFPPRRCSRYQFECRRGGECIAVYNACDGVPQCADGSDEAPELGCPPSASPPAPAAAPAPATPAPHPPPTAPAAHAVPPFKPLQESGEGEATAERWPHRLAQAQPPRRYGAESASSGGGSHIFSHKGGLVQETEGGGYAAFEPPPAWPRRGWPPAPPAPPAHGDVTPATAARRYGPVAGVELAGWGGYARDWDGDARRAWPVPPRVEPEMPVYIPAKTMPEVPAVYSSVQQTLRDSAKKGPPESRPGGGGGGAPGGGGAGTGAASPDLREEVPQLAAAAPPVVDSEPSKPKWERHLAADEHDGLSERPPAAVLLLVLGVSLTAALGALLACRARALTRRLRRGKPFAHDADYLVNGMYL